MCFGLLQTPNALADGDVVDVEVGCARKQFLERLKGSLGRVVWIGVYAMGAVYVCDGFVLSPPLLRSCVGIYVRMHSFE